MSYRGRGVLVAACMGGAVLLAVAALRHILLRGSFLGYVTTHPRAYLLAAGIELLAASALTIAGLRVHRRRHPPPRATFVLATTASLLIVVLAGIRLRHARAEQRVVARDARLRAMEMHDWKQKYALRLAAAAQEDFHLRTGRFAPAEQLQLEGGNLPHGVSIEVQLATSGWRLIARRNGTVRQCVLARNQASSLAMAGEPVCSDSIPMLERVQPRPFTEEPDRAMARGQADGIPWPQYRRTAARDGLLLGSASPAGWISHAGGPLRATASAGHGLLLTGTHGNGILSAYDARTGALRWRTQVPNWIHQDPVVAGNVVAVGYGDNRTVQEPGDSTFRAGQGPSGVSVHDLRTGLRRWAAGETGAVMTSPVVAGDVLIYGTRERELIARRLDTGEELWRRGLRGRVTMGSPALLDSVLLVGQDEDAVCTYALRTGAEGWCYRFPTGFGYAGHSAPTVAGGTAYLTGLLETPGAQLLGHRSVGNRLRLVRDVLLGREPDYFGVQILAAVDMATGRPKWTRTFPGEHAPIGHTSGTVVPGGDRVFVVMPVPRLVLALDPGTGRTLWQRSLARTRGPPTVLADVVLVSDASGYATVLDAASGRVRCRYHLGEGTDRAGPTIAGQTAYFTGLRGGVYAIPLRTLLGACPADRASG